MVEAAAALQAADLIAAAKPQALVCQIDGREQGLEEAATNYRDLSRQTVAPVTLEIILQAREPADKEVAAIARAVNAAGLTPASVVVTQMHDLKSFQPNTPRPWGPTYEEMATAARNSFPDVVLGGGMLSYFTELNRKPVPKGVFDFITHTGCPIVHAPDDISVMETLETLPWIFFSARTMIGKVPYHIGPTSIPCRDNPYGAAVAPNPDNRRVCLSDIDPRQRGLFAAAWNLGYLSAAARAGVDAVALGSATGSQGMIYRKLDHTQPWFDRGGARVYPTYHVIVGVAAASGARRIVRVLCLRCALAYRSRRRVLPHQPVRRDQRVRSGLQALPTGYSRRRTLKQRCTIRVADSGAPSSARWEALTSSWGCRIRRLTSHVASAACRLFH
jgi:hypothetical protein